MNTRLPYRQFLFQESDDFSQNEHAFSTVQSSSTGPTTITPTLLTESNFFIERLKIVALCLAIFVLVLVSIMLIFCLKKLGCLQRRLVGNTKLNDVEVLFLVFLFYFSFIL